MNLPLFGLPKFEKFMLEVYGVTWLKSVQPGERLRCVLQERLIIVREHEIRRSAEAVEVFCSDKDLAREIEESFLVWLNEVEGEEVKTTSTDAEASESGE